MFTDTSTFVDYKNGKIYKLVSNKTMLCRQYSSHRSTYKRYLKGNSYYISHQQNQLIENYPCNNENELKRREDYWIKELDCVNKMVAGRTKEKYRKDNNKFIKKFKKEYYHKIKKK